MLLLAKVGSLLLKGEKKFLFILLILTFFTSLLEILGISLIIPITYSLVDNEIFVQNNRICNNQYQFECIDHFDSQDCNE